MSEPDDAASATRWGLCSYPRTDSNPVDVDLQFLGNHLRDLDEEALAHFGAAVIQQQRAIGVNVKQTACLIEVRRGERKCRTSPASARSLA